MATVDEQLTQRNANDTARINAQTAGTQALASNNKAESQALADQWSTQDKAQLTQNNQDAWDRAHAMWESEKKSNAARQGEDQATYNERLAEYTTALQEGDAAAKEEKAKRDAEALSKYNAGKEAAQGQYNSDLAAASARRAELINAAQRIYKQRNAEAQSEYDRRSEESQGKINSMYDAYLEAQNQQYKKALDQGVAAQEEARAGMAKGYQTAANDLSVQAERNRRNMNLQALANGLNTGTGSQMQLAANQAYLKNYGNLRGEEAAQNAAIDRAIANLKVDYENNIAQALADNNFQRASALLDDYKTQVAWLDSQRNRNQDYLDTQTMNAENRYDTLSDQARAYLNSQNQYLQSAYDSALASNYDYLDTTLQNNQNRYDTYNLNNQNFLDTSTAANRNRLDSAKDLINQTFDDTRRFNQNTYNNSEANTRNYLVNAITNANNLTANALLQGNSDINNALANNQNWADKQKAINAETLASYGDFSGYAALGYDQNTINAMKQMWINQNPQMAWQAGLIDDATYLRWLTGPQGEAGGGGGGGYYGDGPAQTPESPNTGGSGKEYKGGGTTANSNSTSAFERAVAAGNSYSSGGKGGLTSTVYIPRGV